MDEEFGLQRSVNPYVGFVIVISGVTAFLAAAGLKMGEWGFIEMAPVLWAFLAAWVYIGTRYRLYWRGDALLQKAWGLADVSIPASDIGRISLEISTVDEAAQGRRPFRRIAIYSAAEHDVPTFIDISLKHFVPRDIKRLMRALARRRPDLEMPKHWT